MKDYKQEIEEINKKYQTDKPKAWADYEQLLKITGAEWKLPIAKKLVEGVENLNLFFKI